MGKNQMVQEAMTADQISSAQSAHYNADDFFRRMLGKLTLEQKRKVADFVQKMIGQEE